MDQIADLFGHPNFYLFLGILSVPILLQRSGNKALRSDDGFRLILWGTCILSFAAFVDFLEDIPFGSFLHDMMPFGMLPGRFSVLFIYLPGVVIVGLGLSRWLPRIQRLNHEIDRRELAEDEIRNLLQTTQDLAQRAEEASHAKSAFLANMSHELRTPLNAILGFAELLSLGIADDNLQKRREYEKNILKSGKHLLSVLSDILDLSKVEAGKMVIEQEPVEVSDVIEDCLEFLDLQIEAKSLQISVTLEEMVLVTDERVLKQIAINLLSNAVKFTPDGGNIKVVGQRGPDRFEISVQDSGIGMSEDELAYVMRPFVQVESSFTKKIEGTGLGLALVQNFAGLLKGSVQMFSEPGKGTTVKVCLPIE